MPKLSDFEGEWLVSRRIEDSLNGQDGRFEGVAVFERDDLGLRYQERGMLTLGGAAMQAERVYLWRESGDGIDVFDAFLPQNLNLVGHIEVAGSTQGVSADGRLLAAANGGPCGRSASV